MDIDDYSCGSDVEITPSDRLCRLLAQQACIRHATTRIVRGDIAGARTGRAVAVRAGGIGHPVGRDSDDAQNGSF
jgi:hypothetical protein